MAPRRQRLSRAESSAITRGRLLRAARTVFPAKGFYGTSLDAVADEAGFSKGAVYSQFENKADLFLAMLQELNRERAAAIAAQVDAAGSVAQVIQAAKAWWIASRGALEPQPGFTVALVEYWAWAGRDPAVAQRVAEEHERMLAEVAEVLDDAIARVGGSLPYPSIEIVRMLTALGRGVTLERHLSGDRVDLIMEPVLDYLLQAREFPLA
jgi:AcrR family transcriptional regulator